MAGAEDETGSDKPFDASPQKLERARKKGEVPRSADLFTVFGYLGVLAVAFLWGASGLDRSAVALLPYIDHPEKLAPLVFGNGDPSGLLFMTARHVIISLLPGFLVPLAAILVVGWATRSLIITPSRLRPRLSRISLLEGAKRKFGADGWFEFLKSVSKLSAVIGIAAWFFAARAERVIGLTGAEPRISVSFMLSLCIDFLAWSCLIVGTISVLDWLWQRASHLRRNRMSYKEMLDETKEAEGDPHLKSARRQKAQDIAKNQMLGKVNGSDVVIVNPTHYAVSLKWSRLPGDAPECVAKGVDEIAAAIRRAAEEARVPIYEDPPTARALFSDTEVGAQVGEHHFRAVAAAIRFSETMRKRARMVSP